MIRVRRKGQVLHLEEKAPDNKIYENEKKITRGRKKKTAERKG